ncbi:winged helix-turn-helix domain-containing protein [Allokutzneria albata]|uniref:Winged helix DNA-binding domain-containing protein n=1 Tax=Allokutzneria albata TaxID=211114 RepID=A0A1G9WP67_ALLAB|nr:transcriptional regulator [Allokutzneria albata]SDM85973.1 Winged helix DNA-binding domain-containing protein [Allokutzneria albata]
MSELDAVIHPMPRLSICAALAAGPEWVEFKVVREATGLSDSMISKHTRVLEEAGYLEVRKGAVGRRPRTWFRLAPFGRTRYLGHVAALRRLVTEVGDTAAGITAPSE